MYQTRLETPSGHTEGYRMDWHGMDNIIMDFEVRQTKAVQILVLLVVTKKLILFHKESSKINEISADRAQSECSSSDIIDDKYYLLLMN